jgi:hypothetical protein
MKFRAYFFGMVKIMAFLERKKNWHFSKVSMVHKKRPISHREVGRCVFWSVCATSGQK